MPYSAKSCCLSLLTLKGDASQRESEVFCDTGVIYFCTLSRCFMLKAAFFWYFSTFRIVNSAICLHGRIRYLSEICTSIANSLFSS